MIVKLFPEERSVESNGKKSKLTPKEYKILDLLMQNPGKTMSSEEIYTHIWQCEPFACEPIVAVHVRHIREKIERDPSKPTFIKSLWGRGYRFNMNSI
ncbi:MAG: winged helix-turn-helix transcriptional regulator [Solobacterium sp.]|nr:winged helix-turn-helix transcriptional regulator [Solobacterium sp.]